MREPVTCRLSPVTGHMSPVPCHLSPVTCHLSLVTCHWSPGQREQTLPPVLTPGVGREPGRWTQKQILKSIRRSRSFSSRRRGIRSRRSQSRKWSRSNVKNTISVFFFLHIIWNNFGNKHLWFFKIRTPPPKKKKIVIMFFFF